MDEFEKFGTELIE